MSPGVGLALVAATVLASAWLIVGALLDAGDAHTERHRRAVERDAERATILARALAIQRWVNASYRFGPRFMDLAEAARAATNSTRVFSEGLSAADVRHRRAMENVIVMSGGKLVSFDEARRPR